jgi:Domain of unknown function (DUF6285)
MKDISDAPDLIATARDALLNDLLPRLQKDQRYTALMIANAMAIAMREQRLSFGAGRDEVARLHRLFAECAIAVAPSDSASVSDELPVLRRTLCSAIRDGSFDDASRSAALVAHLARTTADWVAISNPKALRTDPSGS